MWWMVAGAAIGAADTYLSGEAESKASEEYNKQMRKSEVLNMVYRNRSIMDNLTHQEEQAALRRTELQSKAQEEQSKAFMSGVDRGIDSSSTASQRVQQVTELKMAQQENQLNKAIENERRNSMISSKQNFEQSKNNILNNARSTKGASIFDVAGGAVSGAMSGQQLDNIFGSK